MPDGTPPPQAVEFEISDAPGEKVSAAEAVNLVSTALAVEVFSGRTGSIKILFKDNAAAKSLTRRLYQDLKVFQPVKSVLDDEDFILESSVGTAAGEKRIWQLRLQNREKKTVWSSVLHLKEGENL